MNKLLSLLSILGLALLSFFSFSTKVLAGEIVISGNGDQSVNSAEVNIQNEQTIVQENVANIENNVDINANTGGNEANGNNGDASVETGDIKVTEEIENNVNESSVEAGCCETDEETSLVISGNASDSQNNISSDLNSLTNVYVNQIANITNNISGFANSGGNSANDNSGNVLIDTGSITVHELIKNSGINVTNVEATIAQINLIAKILNNGANSTSEINADFNNNLETIIENIANIENNSFWNLVTGENEANGNLGDVSITTGDILFISTIINEDINKSKVKVKCGCPEDGDDGPKDNGEEPPPPPPPDKKDDNPPPPPSNNCCPSPPSQGGDALGAALGALLPDTGGNWLLLMTILAGILFALGWYLRLHPGVAPNKKYI